MPGTRKPNRENSRQGSYQHKYKTLKDEIRVFKIQVAKYQGAVHELAVSASQAQRRVGMLTQTVLACRKHFAAETHATECNSIGEGTGSIPEPCDCGRDAILEGIDKALAEPDLDPGAVKIEIKDDAEVQSEVSTTPAPSVL